MQSNRYHAMGTFSLSLLVLSLVLLGTSTDALAQDRTALMDRYEQLTVEFNTAFALHKHNATTTTKKALDRISEALTEFKRVNRATWRDAGTDQQIGFTPYAQKREPDFLAPQAITNTYPSTDTPLPIIDLTNTFSTISVGDNGTILDINVGITIKHTWIGDLRIDLISPAGHDVLLWANECGSTENLITTFDDGNGETLLCADVAGGGFLIDSYEYRLINFEGLLRLNGDDAAGDWTLIVGDYANLDDGTLESWSLEITTESIDLELDKTCSAYENGTGTFGLTVTNTSDTDATGVVVEDWFPDLVEITGWSGDGTLAGGVWTVGDVGAGGSASITIDFTFNDPGVYYNHAEIIAADQTDNDSTPGDGGGDDYADCAFLVLDDRTVAEFVPENAGGVADRGPRATADIYVKKTVDVETASVNTMVHYTVVVGNYGPQSTAKVQVTDHLPECLVDPTWTTTRGDYDGWVWDIGALKVDKTDTLQVWATVGPDCEGTVTNEAWKSRSTLPDPSSVTANDPNSDVEPPFSTGETRRNNHAEASFEVTAANGRMLDGTTFALGNNYPNPFNPTTMVPFSLAEAAHVSIKVYDMLGREIMVLVDGTMSAGMHEVAFEASALPTGVYLIRMQAVGTVHIQRVTLMK